MSSWVGNPGKPPYVIPRGSAGLKKNVYYSVFWCCTKLKKLATIIGKNANLRTFSNDWNMLFLGTKKTFFANPIYVPLPKHKYFTPYDPKLSVSKMTNKSTPIFKISYLMPKLSTNWIYDKIFNILKTFCFINIFPRCLGFGDIL